MFEGIRRTAAFAIAGLALSTDDHEPQTTTLNLNRFRTTIDLLVAAKQSDDSKTLTHLIAAAPPDFTESVLFELEQKQRIEPGDRGKDESAQLLQTQRTCAILFNSSYAQKNVLLDNYVNKPTLRSAITTALFQECAEEQRQELVAFLLKCCSMPIDSILSQDESPLPLSEFRQHRLAKVEQVMRTEDSTRSATIMYRGARHQLERMNGEQKVQLKKWCVAVAKRSGGTEDVALESLRSFSEQNTPEDCLDVILQLHDALAAELLVMIYDNTVYRAESALRAGATEAIVGQITIGNTSEMLTALVLDESAPISIRYASGECLRLSEKGIVLHQVTRWLDFLEHTKDPTLQVLMAKILTNSGPLEGFYVGSPHLEDATRVAIQFVQQRSPAAKELITCLRRNSGFYASDPWPHSSPPFFTVKKQTELARLTTDVLESANQSYIDKLLSFDVLVGEPLLSTFKKSTDRVLAYQCLATAARIRSLGFTAEVPERDLLFALHTLRDELRAGGTPDARLAGFAALRELSSLNWSAKNQTNESRAIGIEAASIAYQLPSKRTRFSVDLSGDPNVVKRNWLRAIASGAETESIFIAGLIKEAKRGSDDSRALYTARDILVEWGSPSRYTKPSEVLAGKSLISTHIDIEIERSIEDSKRQDD